MKSSSIAARLVTEHPILFSAPMVRALLDGRKTQTRRIVKWLDGNLEPKAKYAIGAGLWVRESWAPDRNGKPAYRASSVSGLPPDDGPVPIYSAAGHHHRATGRWRPSIHMPRAFSRLTLTVTDVRVQRLQEISEEDAQAEGAKKHPIDWPNSYEGPPVTYLSGFRWIWQSINGEASWDANPFVAAYTFTVEKKNIDA